jgi:hypothetical protein
MISKVFSSSIVLVNLFNCWLSHIDIVGLDSAICNHGGREIFFRFLNRSECILPTQFNFSESPQSIKVFDWFATHQIRFLNIHLTAFRNVQLLKDIVKFMGSRLHSLTVERCLQRKADLLFVNTDLKRLISLNVLNCGLITDAVIIVDINNEILKNLENISIIDCKNVGDRACVYLSQHCSSLISFIFGINCQSDDFYNEEIEALDEATGTSMLKMKTLKVLNIHLDRVSNALLRVIHTDCCLVHVNIQVHSNGKWRGPRPFAWVVNVSVFDDAISCCLALQTFVISTPKNRVIFKYVKGEKVCLTNCAVGDDEIPDLIRFFERHSFFKSVQLRSFCSLSELVLYKIAKQNPCLITLKIHLCGSDYGVTAMCMFFDMCPNIKNFSLAACNYSLIGVNNFTRKLNPNHQSENVNVLFIQKKTVYSDYYSTYAWKSFCDLSYTEMGDEDNEYWFDANELMVTSYKNIDGFLDDM